MESLQADSWIFLFVIPSLDLMAVLSPTSCLTTAFHPKIPIHVSVFWVFVYSRFVLSYLSHAKSYDAEV
jgi:hypothetical protein